MSDERLHTVHMTSGHFEAYQRWLAEHDLNVIPMSDPIFGFPEDEDHWSVGIAESNPGLQSAPVLAPWNAEQVVRIEAWQCNEGVHPLTCHEGHKLGVSSECLSCPVCGYEQTWVPYMVVNG